MPPIKNFWQFGPLRLLLLSSGSGSHDYACLSRYAAARVPAAADLEAVVQKEDVQLDSGTVLLPSLARLGSGIQGELVEGN